MEVYNSKYLHVAFFAGQHLLEATWLSETKMMDTEDCKQEFLNYLDIIRKRRPSRVVVDSSNMLFTFNPKMQDWINETIHKHIISTGIHKLAFVVSKDFFAQLSIKQTMDEKEGLKFVTQFFDSKETAKKWVLSAA
ncbi:MAG: hypothetical protein WAO71_14875 [Gallionella sp.]